LLTLINEVLDITRIEVGRLDLSPESLDLAELLHEVVNLTHPMAEQHGVKVEIDEPSTADARVLADKQRLKQVLLNLVSNAIKYNVEGGSVRIFCEPAPPQALRIHVQDTGVGIAPAKQKRLFTPFDRLGAEMSAVEGSGLGLVLSKHLAEVMGGVLSFSSQPGHGSIFTVELPHGKSAQTPLDDLSGPLTATAIDASPARTVLYIEDNHANVQLVESILGFRPGVRLVSAREGEEGLEQARRHRPDLILLDVHLPDMKGSELLAVIRAEPELRDIPVIVVSADATALQIDRLRAAGAAEYLTKPIDVDHFLRILDHYLRTS
jgi:CheY-like chemotaxis protein